MLLADLVATSAAVARDPLAQGEGRGAGRAVRCPRPDEIVPAIAALSGVPRQGKIGVGWANAAIVGAATTATLTIGDLDGIFTTLGATSGAGSQARRRALLDDLAARATPEEADFVRRLLLGELRQGALASLVTDAVAIARAVPGALVRRAAMLSGDLPETARLALTADDADGAREAFEAVGMTVGTAVQPMLASTAADVAEALAATGPASVEWKLDGARVQAHRHGDEVRLYTRNLNEITERLPGAGRRSCAGCRSTRSILDGEALGVGEDGLPAAFQDSMSSFGRGRRTGATPAPTRLAAVWFDILHLDGVDLIDRPLAERLDVMALDRGLDRIPGVRDRRPRRGADGARRVARRPGTRA